MKRTILTAAASFVLWSTTSWAADIPKGQLPDSVTPSHYTLNLKVLPEELRFSGDVGIDIQLSVATSTIWLHGQDLAVISSRVVVDGKSVASQVKLIAQAKSLEELMEAGINPVDQTSSHTAHHLFSYLPRDTVEGLFRQ